MAVSQLPSHRPQGARSKTAGPENYVMVVGVLCGLLGVLAGFTFGHIHGMHATCATQTLTRVQPCRLADDALVTPERERELVRRVEEAAKRVAALERAQQPTQKVRCPTTTMPPPPEEDPAAAAAAAAAAKCPTCPECPTRPECPPRAPPPDAAAPATSKREEEEEEDTPCEEMAEHASNLEAEVAELAAALRAAQDLNAEIKDAASKKDATLAAAAKGGGGGDPRKSDTFEALLGRTVWRSVEAVDRETLWKDALAGFPYAAGATTSQDALVFKRDPTQPCEELNVVSASNKPGVCLAVFDSRLPVYTMLRIDRTKGELLEAERKKLSPKKHAHPGADAYSKERLANRALVLSQADTLPKAFALKESLAATAAFAAKAPNLVSKVKTIVRERQLAKNAARAVVVMATNFGTIDLVANFACSCQSTAGLEASLKSVLVFAADAATADAVESLGLAAFHDAALGDLPEAPATTYGDHAFVRMMWLKVTAVYLVVAAGANALFQDADVVWLKDPLQFFADVADPEVDSYWMDDGARSSRYTPFYANSGFYFLRANDRVLYFMHRLLLSYDNVLAVRSHQHALIMLLLEHCAKYGLTVHVLDAERFPQGQVFHHRKSLMQDIVDGKTDSWVFHMCWTAGRVDKLKYMKHMGLWFLQPTCTLDSWQAAKLDFSDTRSAPSPFLSHDRSACCSGVKAFQAPTPYVDEITIRPPK